MMNVFLFVKITRHPLSQNRPIYNKDSFTRPGNTCANLTFLNRSAKGKNPCADSFIFIPFGEVASRQFSLY